LQRKTAKRTLPIEDLPFEIEAPGSFLLTRHISLLFRQFPSLIVQLCNLVAHHVGTTITYFYIIFSKTMKNQSTKPQIPIEKEENSPGLGSGEGSWVKDRDGEKEVLRLARKRVRFDKEGHPLVRQGHQFRKDHLKLYKIHAALKDISQQDLINKALEYYKVNVLSKTQAQKLRLNHFCGVPTCEG
jgi:hypothetical protein